MKYFDLIPFFSEPKMEIFPKRDRYDKNLEDIVDRIWENEMRENGTLLHNGSILSLRDFDGITFHFEITQYKYFIAQLRQPELIKEINILPVGVTGITTAGEYILIGKRSNFVSMNPNHYELAPAGSLDSNMSINQQVIKEMEEEIGIPQQEILKITPIALAKDLKQNYAEIIHKIELLPDAMEKTLFSNLEYSSILWMTKKQLKEHIILNEKEYVPMSIFLIENLNSAI